MRPLAGRAATLAPLLIVSLALVALFALRFQVLFTQNVNWDEFAFLAKVHAYLRGELSSRLLTFHVHFFTWVPTTVDGELRQVVAMRVVMFGCALSSAFSTYVVGRRLLGSAPSALFAVVAGQSLSHVITHGASARYDPVVAAAFLGAGALLLSERRGATAVAGVLFAVGAMVSLKILLFLPSLLGLLALWALFPAVTPGGARTDAARAALQFVASLGVAFGVLYVAHAATLAPAPRAVGQLAVSNLTSMAGRALGDHDGNTGKYLASSLTWDWGVWTLCALGVAMAIATLASPRRSPAERRASAGLLCLALPLIALVAYRNSFPYFYTCVVPPASLVAALPLARLLRAIEQRPLAASLAAILALVPQASRALEWRAYNLHDQLASQGALLEAVHQVFPAPVPYVDRCSMVGSFPKVGPFMSGWVMGQYRRAGQPIMRELLERERPLFLLQNIETLRLAKAWDPNEPRRLLREDFEVLRDNFVPYWGPLWVAGKTVRITDGAGAFDIVIAGPYRVAEPVALRLDGIEVEPGAIVELAVGAHHLEVHQPDGIDRVTLRTAGAKPAPDTEPPRGNVFQGFAFHRRPRVE